ncbi:hypothetical protein [Methanosarcina sp.]
MREEKECICPGCPVANRMGVRTHVLLCKRF